MSTPSALSPNASSHVSDMLSLISDSEFDPDAVVEIPAATAVPVRARWAILVVAAENGHVDAMEVLLQLNTDCMHMYVSELTAALNAAALFAARSVSRRGQASADAYAPLFLLLRSIHADSVRDELSQTFSREKNVHRAAAVSL
jgi:hypothetical protein